MPIHPLFMGKLKPLQLLSNVYDSYIINIVKYDMARYKLANGAIVINSAFCNSEWMRVFVCTGYVWTHCD